MILLVLKKLIGVMTAQIIFFQKKKLTVPYLINQEHVIFVYIKDLKYNKTTTTK